MRKNYTRIAQISESPIEGTPSRRAQAVRDSVLLFARLPVGRQRARLTSGRTPVDNPLRSQVEERELVPPRSPLQVDRCLASLDELVDRAPGQHRRGRFGKPTDPHIIGTHDLRTSILVPEQQQDPLRNAGLDGVVCRHDMIPRSRAQHENTRQFPRSPTAHDSARRRCPSPRISPLASSWSWSFGPICGHRGWRRFMRRLPIPVGTGLESLHVRPQCRRKTNHRTGLGNQCDTTIIHRSPDEPRGLDS